ncbi:MAG TPA: DUF2309 domain-containing protein [Solibacterales bacterium]|nr:DUF2309 domain-containing protein [Bryobacterales bacterium]
MHTADGLDVPSVLRHAIHHAGHLLPIQGPIGVFIHHNTLHAFQHLPFEDAVVAASRLLGTEPYMREDQFRSAIASGRILMDDIAAVLLREEDAPVAEGLTRRALRQAMLVPGVRSFHPATISWDIEEGGLRADPLFAAALQLPAAPAPPVAPPARPRDGLLAATGVDLDEIVNPVLIRLASAYLDQGMAYWPMPDRERGFYGAVQELLRRGGAVFPEALNGLRTELQPAEAETSLLASLDALGVRPFEFEALIAAEALSLPGWSGLMHRLEQEPSLAPHEILECALVDFLAVRMALTLSAARSVAQRFGRAVPAWRVAAAAPDLELARLVQAATVADAARLAGLPASAVTPAFQREVLAFDSVERRRVLQLAYELRHEDQILTPLAEFRAETGPPQDPPDPSAQVFFCIDEREESIRRHLEEHAPTVETLGAAGFFGIAVDYAGIDDAHGVALCPVVVKPQHAVRELPHPEHRDAFERRKALRLLWARIARAGFVSSRSLVRGAISTAALGLFSIFPLIAHILTPRHWARLTRALNRWILPEPRTELTLMRSGEEGHAAAESLLLGFTVEEKADRVAGVLRPAGLLTRFAPIVVVLGHGSTSLNNPHESAHDCGACGGRRGGPNGRLFAAMANHPGVRATLRNRGIDIPDATWFVGGYHDTCSDEIEYFDLEYMPDASRAAFDAIRRQLDRARELDAHERARRFEAASHQLDPAAALRHVQERSEHLAEPRPEYGHCTNAVCIVGRRALSRGLFFDRRAFLVSYDPAIDPEGENLARVLGAAMPVCAGISLEYYFSFVDNEGYGCGTKLPHNVTGLVGVMNGQASDLRTGLPWQMVEIHEPVRILFVVEARHEVLSSVIAANPLLRELLENRWIRVSTIHPDSGHVHVWRDHRFEARRGVPFPIPSAPTSVDWYAGKRDHLPVARIGQLEPSLA